MNKEYIYRKAIDTWGAMSQVDMAIEECSELIKSLIKRRRNPSNPVTTNNVLEEMADVAIMIEQLKVIYDYTYDDTSRFELLKKQKIIRLLRRLE